MVGKRTWARDDGLSNGEAKPRRRKPVQRHTADDLRDERPRLFQYSDLSSTEVEEARREEMKNKLMDAMDDLERFRMPDEKVSRECVGSEKKC